MTLFLGALAVGILFWGQGAIAQFINIHGLILVFGGTGCIVLLMTPKNSMANLMKMLVKLHKDDEEISVKDFGALLQNPNAQIRDPYGLIAQARDLWEIGVNDKEFEDLITAQAEAILNRNMATISILRNLGKYPPALGMVGTVMGMIQLFSGLGSSANQNQIGMQLALAMTATFYGLLLSNFALLPFADRLEVKEERRRANLEKTVNILSFIQKNQPKIISERVLHAS